MTQKQALVFAAAGAVGSAVARRLAADGLAVHLSGRGPDSVAGLAGEIQAAGGTAACGIVDATDDGAVGAWVDGIVRETGRIDVVFNAIGLRCAEAGYATRSTTLPLRQFLLPLATITGSHFLTARHAARHMIPQASGSIVLLSASLAALFVPCMAGITAACGAIEAMTRSLAAELGPHGVRVNCVRAAGMPSTRTIQETAARMRETLGPPATPPRPGVLGRSVTPDDVAAAVSHLASERAGAITGQVLNVCAGEVV